MLRKNGIFGTGILALMKSVGLTQGGFYAHFASKEVLVKESSVFAMLQTAARLERAATEAGAGSKGMKALVEAYLSESHFGRTEGGCVVAAVAAELAREPLETRRAVTDSADKLIAVIAKHLPAGTFDRDGVARAVLGLMAGTLQLARLSVDRKRAVQILESGRDGALKLAGVAD